MDTGNHFGLLADPASAMLSVVIFLGASTLAFALFAGVRARQAVRRRAATLGPESEAAGGRLDFAGLLQRLLEYTTKHYATADQKDTKILRGRMVQAGIYDPNAVAYFFIARIGLATGLAGLMLFALPLFGISGKTSFWLFVIAGGMGGYLAPSFFLDRRIAVRRDEHRMGFPDLMDLLVVCSDAGLAMEAALDRVRRELGHAYPSLGANIHIAILEIRAGRSLTEALEHFGDRLGLEEARAFAALIQQSDAIGASISKALRVYSDDMRHKRMSRAEEKAYSLPTKLSVPMMVCIFPVLFVVILTPVIVRYATSHW